MAIGKLPKRNINNFNDNNEEKIKSFIEKSNEQKNNTENFNKKSKTPIMIRFDSDLLKKVEIAAKNRGVNRSALIQYLVSRSLELDNV